MEREYVSMTFGKTFYKHIRNKALFLVRHNKFRGLKNNKINFGENTRFRNCKVTINGVNNVIEFGDYCDLRWMSILVNGDNNRIEIGDNVTINALDLKPTRINASKGTTIRIGDGSLLSNDVELHSSDYHNIYDLEFNRVNPDKDIYIGENVWIGLGTKVLKGARISDNSVVGACSMVTKEVSDENVIIAGNPARVIKRGITWEK